MNQEVNIGPFVLHLSERTTLRIMPMLPTDRDITFVDFREAMVRIVAEDAEAFKGTELQRAIRLIRNAGLDISGGIGVPEKDKA